MTKPMAGILGKPIIPHEVTKFSITYEIKRLILYQKFISATCASYPAQLMLLYLIGH